MSHSSSASSNGVQMDQEVSQNPSTSMAYSIIDINDFVPISMNNLALEINTDKFEEKYHLMLEFLRHHYISYALSAREDIPYILLQNFWHTSSYDTTENAIIGRIDAETSMRITKNKLRQILHLPKPSDRGLRSYDEMPSSNDIIVTLREVGYNEVITQLSKFRRMHLPPIWNFLFSVINRCLTGKKGSFDQANMNVLSIFHGLVQGLNLDFAQLLWNDLKASQEPRHKSKTTFVSYHRFWGLFIARAIEESELQYSNTRQLAPQQYMSSFKASGLSASIEESADLNDGMLRFIPPVLSVLRVHIGSMAVQEPESPTHEHIPMSMSGEGSMREVEGENIQEGGGEIRGDEQSVGVQEMNIDEQTESMFGDQPEGGVGIQSEGIGAEREVEIIEGVAA